MDLGRFGLAPSTTRSHPLRPSIVLPTAAASDPFSVYTGHCRSDLAKANRRVMTRHKSTLALQLYLWQTLRAVPTRLGGSHGQVRIRCAGAARPHPDEPVTEIYNVDEALSFLQNWDGDQQSPVYQVALNRCFGAKVDLYSTEDARRALAGFCRNAGISARDMPQRQAGWMPIWRSD